MKWINTEQTTLERAKELLSSTVAEAVYIRWSRMEYGGNTGTPFGKVAQYSTYKLIGVTSKRLKVQNSHGGQISYADPGRCYFAARSA